MSQEISQFLSKMQGTYQAEEMKSHKNALLQKELTSKEVPTMSIEQFLASYNAAR